jgi:hypothetical protein
MGSLLVAKQVQQFRGQSVDDAVAGGRQSLRDALLRKRLELPSNLGSVEQSAVHELMRR